MSAAQKWRENKDAPCFDGKTHANDAWEAKVTDYGVMFSDEHARLPDAELARLGQWLVETFGKEGK